MASKGAYFTTQHFSVGQKRTETWNSRLRKMRINKVMERKKRVVEDSRAEVLLDIHFSLVFDKGIGIEQCFSGFRKPPTETTSKRNIWIFFHRKGVATAISRLELGKNWAMLQKSSGGMCKRIWICAFLLATCIIQNSIDAKPKNEMFDQKTNFIPRGCPFRFCPTIERVFFELCSTNSVWRSFVWWLSDSQVFEHQREIIICTEIQRRLFKENYYSIKGPFAYTNRKALAFWDNSSRNKCLLAELALYRTPSNGQASIHTYIVCMHTYIRNMHMCVLHDKTPYYNTIQYMTIQ